MSPYKTPILQLVILYVLLFISAKSTYAQNSFVFPHISYGLKPSNGHDLHLAEFLVSKSSQTHHLDSLLFFNLIDSTLYVSDLKSRSFRPIALPKDPELGRMYAHENSENVLLWDYGVGRVFNYNFKHNKLDRLDQSFPHRNQYGHASWVNPKDLKIFAFGGYGLFTNKGFTTVYDPLIKHWTQFQDKTGTLRPLHPLHCIQIDDESLFFISTPVVVNWDKAERTVPNTRALFWLFNIYSGEWKLINSLSYNLSSIGEEYIGLQENRNDRIDDYAGTFTGLYSSPEYKERPLVLHFTFTINKPPRLLLIDPLSGRHTTTTISPIYPTPKRILNGMLDAQKQIIYLAGAPPNLDFQLQHNLFIYEIELPPFSVLQHYLNENSKPPTPTDLSTYFLEAPPSLLISFLKNPLNWIFGLLFAYMAGWVFARNKAQNEDDLFSELNVGSLNVGPIGLFHILNEDELYFKDKSIHGLLNTGENAILKLFISKKNEGIHQILTDELNELFESPYSTLDYARKQRNLCLKSLEDKLQQLYPTGLPYIVHTRSPQDFRKRYYTMNWELLGLD